MPNIETLREEDESLKQMYRADLDSGLSEADKKAYQELIDSQRSGHEATRVEVRNESGKTEEIEVRSIGNKAIQSPFAVHSESWHTEEK